MTWGSWEPDPGAPEVPVPPTSAPAAPQYGWTQQYAPAPVPYDPAGAAAHAAVPVWAAPTREERTWAAAAHWLPLLTHWVGPLLILLTRGRRSARVRAEAAASLNWEITVAVLLAASALLARFGAVGSIVAIAVVLFSIGQHILGAVTASRGGSFAYPLALPIVR